MKRSARSLLFSMAIILGACVLAAAAAGGRPQKKCYDSSGNEIPCPNSNYSETQFAARATARKAGPTAPAVAATARPSATASPTVTATATPTVTPTAEAAAGPTLIYTQQATPAAGSGAAQTSTGGSPITLALLVAVIGFAGLVVVILAVVLLRRFGGRSNQPPG